MPSPIRGFAPCCEYTPPGTDIGKPIRLSQPVCEAKNKSGEPFKFTGPEEKEDEGRRCQMLRLYDCITLAQAEGISTNRDNAIFWTPYF